VFVLISVARLLIVLNLGLLTLVAAAGKVDFIALVMVRNLTLLGEYMLEYQRQRIL
jgi:hypothetical protein